MYKLSIFTILTWCITNNTEKSPTILTFHSHFTSSRYFLSELVSPHEHSLYWLAAGWCWVLLPMFTQTVYTVQYSTVQYSTVQNLTCQPGVLPSNAGTHTDISHTWTLRDTHTWAGFSIAIVSGLLWAIDWGIIILYCVLSYSTFTQYYLISVCLERWVDWWM